MGNQLHFMWLKKAGLNRWIIPLTCWTHLKLSVFSDLSISHFVSFVPCRLVACSWGSWSSAKGFWASIIPTPFSNMWVTFSQNQDLLFKVQGSSLSNAIISLVPGVVVSVSVRWRRNRPGTALPVSCQSSSADGSRRRSSLHRSHRCKLHQA